MKTMKIETIRTMSQAGRDEKSRLELRRRPVADLSEKQMEDAAGGHPHNTCEPTCPPTCCPTCPATCGDTCGNTCPAPCTDPPTPTQHGETCPAGLCETV